MSVKLALLKSGEDVIADFSEMVVNDNVVGYLAKSPYVVKINRTDIPHENEPTKVGLSYFPWMPLSKQKDIPIDPQWIVTMVEPVEEVKQSYAIITYNGSTASDKQEYYCFKKLDAPL